MKTLINTITRYVINESKFDVYKKKYPEYTDALIALSKAPLLRPYKYIEFFIKAIGKQKFIVPRPGQNKFYTAEDIEKTITVIKDFENLQSKLPQKDINKYNDIDELETTIDQYSLTQKKKRQIIKDEDVELVYQDNLVTAYLILSEEAAIKYGKGTTWCISALQDNAFKYYGPDGNIFVFLFIGEDKFAISYATHRLVLPEFEYAYNALNEQFLHDEIDEDVDGYKTFVKFGLFNIVENKIPPIIKKFFDTPSFKRSKYQKQLKR